MNKPWSDCAYRMRTRRAHVSAHAVVPICLFLGIDSVWKAYEVSQKNSPKRRFRQVIVDAIVDSTCMIVPLCIIWFVYELPITRNQYLLMIGFPAFCLTFRLNVILQDSFRVTIDDNIIKKVRMSVSMEDLAKHRNIFQMRTQKLLSYLQ